MEHLFQSCQLRLTGGWPRGKTPMSPPAPHKTEMHVKPEQKDLLPPPPRGTGTGTATARNRRRSRGVRSDALAPKTRYERGVKSGVTNTHKHLQFSPHNVQGSRAVSNREQGNCYPAESTSVISDTNAQRLFADAITQYFNWEHDFRNMVMLKINNIL